MAEARSWNCRRGWSAVFSVFLLTLVSTPLEYFGIPVQRHGDYVAGIADLGATVSPLTDRVYNWAAIARGDHKGAEIMPWVATGVELPLLGEVPPFSVENYVPDELVDWVKQDLQEETDAGRFVAVDESSLVGKVAVGVVKRFVEGKWKYRKVHDFSRPLGSAVNDLCEKSSKKFATVKRAAGLLRPGFWMAKIDLHKAFRYVGMALDSLKYLGCKFEGLCLMDTRLPMGLTIAPGVFHELTSLIERCLKTQGVTAVVYLDDFLIVAETEEACARGFNMLIDLVRWLGFDVSEEKVELPTRRITFLGIELDTRNGEVAMYLSERKVASLQDLCAQFVSDHQRGKSPKVKEFESLLGKLNFASQVVQYSRIYLRAGYALIARAKKLNWFRVRPSPGLLDDLGWWSSHLADPGSRRLLLQRRKLVRDFFATDASTGYGMGGFFDGRFFSVAWTETISWQLDVPSPKSCAQTSSINYLELFALYYALVLWGSLLSGSAILAHTDSSTVYNWLSSNYVKGDSYVNRQLVKAVFKLCAKYDVIVVPKWISTKSNLIADILSRGSVGSSSRNGKLFQEAVRDWKAQGFDYRRVKDTDDWKVLPSLFDTWDSRWGPFDVDGCCDIDGANSQLDSFWSDFCANDCRGLNVYANPPYRNSVILAIVEHLLLAKRDHPAGTAALLVLPFWWDQPYWQRIIALPRIFEVVDRIETGTPVFTSPNAGGGDRKYCGPTQWPVVIVRMSPAVPDVEWSQVLP